MSVQEVTQLRRAGQYAEACAMSKEEWEADCQNPWLQGSYFWSMYKLCTEVLLPKEKRDEAKQLLPAMEQLLPTMKDGDGVGRKCYGKLREMLLPHADVVKRCSNEAKAKPLEAYQELSALPLEELAPELHEQCGWVLYWYLKAKMADKDFSAEQMAQLCVQYCGLSLTLPSRLHSLVLSMVSRFARSHQEFHFMTFWEACGLHEQLREEDWQRTQKDGKEWPSLAEDCARALPKSEGSEEETRYVWEFLGMIVQKGTADENTLRDYARLCAKVDNDPKQAREIYAKLLLGKNAQYYLWAESSNYVEDNDTKIALLLKALRLQPKEEFLGKIHLALADVLIQEHFLVDAEKEIEKLVSCYQKNRWRVPSACFELADRCKDKTNNRPLDRASYESLAEDYAYGDLPQAYGYVDYINQDKRMLHIIDDKLKMQFHKRNPSIKQGNFVTFRVLEDRIVALKPVGRDEAMSHFPKCIAVVDNVNEEKELFHVRGAQGFSVVVRDHTTTLRPAYGDLLSITYGVKERKGKKEFIVLDAQPSDKPCYDLKREAVGTVDLHWRKADGADSFRGEDSQASAPDYGFIEGMYIPKEVLRRAGIREECQARAKALVDEFGRWRVYDITKCDDDKATKE